MIERFFFDRVKRKRGDLAVDPADELPLLAHAHGAHAVPAFMNQTRMRTQSAADTAVFRRPVFRRVIHSSG